MSHRTLFTLALVLAVGLTAFPLAAVADDGPATAEKAKPAAKKAAAQAQRRPMLWMVEGTPRVYLYGTIHVADGRVTKHLPVVQAAFDQSTAVYTELRLDPQGQMEMQMAVMQLAAMPDKTLSDVLGADLHARVSKLVPKNIPFAMLQNTKPWLTNFLLMQTLLQEHSAKQMREKAARREEEAKAGETDDAPEAGDEGPATALDPLIYAQAQKAGKKVGGLETIKTQIDVFNDLTIESQVKMIKDLVEEIEKVQAASKKEAAETKAADGKTEDAEETHVNALSKMVDMWLAGDDQGFLEIFETDLRKTGGEQAEAFVEGLINSRNIGMTLRVLKLMVEDPKQTYFVAVGAGHMPGEKGMVHLFERAGFKVRRVELGTTLPAPAKKKEPAPVK